MRTLLLAVLILQASTCWTQSSLIDRQGTVRFKASKETFVPVKAENKKVTAILNLQSGEFASVVLVKEFVFKNALMQEHFNENYMESERYPKITFEGAVLDFDEGQLNTVPTRYLIKGSMAIHGVRQKISVPLEIFKKDDMIFISSEFSLKPEDFEIKIPRIVRYKIANEVLINLEFKLQTP